MGKEGKLPEYGALNGFKGFRGGNMAYLVGSAYLEWLERKELARPGEKDVLKKLWRKLSKGRGRNFDAVFLGTFGFGARDGYDRFRAEITADALAFEQRMKEQHLTREGSVFAKIDGEISDLSLNPDGTRLMARVVTSAFKGLRVWDLKESIKPNPESKRLKTPDPDITPFMPTKSATWELGRRNGLIPEKPAWAKVGKAGEPSKKVVGTGSTLDRYVVWFSYREPDDEGVLRRRAMSWRLGESSVPIGPLEAPVTQEMVSPVRAMESDGLLSIWGAPLEGPGQPAADSRLIPIVRTPSAAWLPALMPDGKSLFYVQLGATGCEIRKLDLALPPLVPKPIPWGDSFFAVDAVKPKADEGSQLPPPVKPPPAQDYAALETMWSGPRSGLTLAPSGKSYELGYGGMDLLDQISWQALGAAGNAAGPRGAMAGLAYHGWRWAPALQVFSSLERPSGQQFNRVEGFDRQRTGSELAFAYESKNTTPAFFKPAIAFERVKFTEGQKADISRSLLGMELGIAHAWNRGEEWGIGFSAQAKDGVGRTDGHHWQSQRSQVQVRISTPWTQLALKAETARMEGDPTPLDRLHLGGLTTSLTPASLDWNRIEQPALPSYQAAGDRMRRLRIELGSGLRAYLEHTAVWDHTQDRPAFTKVAGLEFDLMQLIGNNESIKRLMGHLAFVAGVHRVLGGVDKDAPMQDRSVSTLSLVLRP